MADNSTVQQIIDFFRGKGLNDVAIAAILGNMRVESNFSTTAYNAGEGAIGLGQWEQGRRTALQNFAAARGLKETDLQAQLGFYWHELNTGYSNVLSGLENATNVQEAANLVNRQFEISGDYTSDRENYAAGYLNSNFKDVAGTTIDTSGNPGANYDSGGNLPDGTTKLSGADYKAALGDLSGLLQAVPELHDILQKALSQGWSEGKFEQSIEQTQWWQNHNQDARLLIAERFSDPATYQTKIANAKSQIENLASQLGVQLAPDQINHLANRYLIEGWDSTTLQGKVGSRYTGTGPAQGEAASFQQQLQQIYGDMGLPISDQAITNRTRQLLSGQTTIDTYQEAAKQAAMSLYPSLAKQLNDGMTVKDIADPYIQDMANTLELDPNSINLTNPLVKKALQGTTITGDNGKSSFTSTPMWQFEQQLRSDPRWQYTQNARDTMATSLMQVGRDMGFEA